jgi:hypothetical protein
MHDALRDFIAAALALEACAARPEDRDALLVALKAFGAAHQALREAVADALRPRPPPINTSWP